MSKIFKSASQLVATLALTITLSACATPATNNIKLSDAELKREQQMQREMAQKHKPKKIEKRKHSNLATYQKRLNRVAAPLAKSAKQLCKSGNCNYEFKIANDDVLNAWADGKSVNFTPIMMDFLETDQELSVVLAHELSHNVMGHINKQKQNVVLGLVVDVAAAAFGGVNTGGLFGGIGSTAYSQGFENEADYIAIYIMALAGQDISNVHHVWRKMSIQTPQGIQASFFSSHPSNPERFLRMEKAIAEVKTKMAANKSLTPNYKS